MARQPQCKPDQRFGAWTIKEPLGVGGNGEVWSADHDSGERRALKILTRTSDEGYARFRREIEIVKSLPAGEFDVLPVLEEHLPDAPSKRDRPWFVMPLATRLTHALKGANLTDRGSAILAISTTLSRLLQERDVNHRDVKPANLFFRDGSFVVGDFGLARRPEDPGLTEEGGVLGPYDFLPSEVFVEDDPDWELVDVYCLAMTLWCVVLERDRPPRIQVGSDSRYSLASMIEDSGECRDLDRLLARATAEDPERRPRLQEFTVGLQDWLQGIDIRDGIVRAYEQSLAEQQRTLRWLVGFAPRDDSLGRALFDVTDAEADSAVQRLNNHQFSDALEQLVGRYLVQAKPYYSTATSPDGWSNVYPTAFGVDEIEDEQVMLGRVLPVLRAIHSQGGVQMISLSPEVDAQLGELHFSASAVFFLLNYLSEKFWVTFDQQYDSGGALILNVKLSHIGMNVLARG